MRADQCVNRGPATAVPICDLDVRPIMSSDNTGMSELMIVLEEHAIPVFTNVSGPTKLDRLVAGTGRRTDGNAVLHGNAERSVRQNRDVRAVLVQHLAAVYRRVAGAAHASDRRG
jgi:hypothetical protein